MMGVPKNKAEKARALFRAEYTVKEIADALGLNEGTIKVITHDLKTES